MPGSPARKDEPASTVVWSEFRDLAHGEDLREEERIGRLWKMVAKMEEEKMRDDQSVSGIAEVLEKLNAKLDDAVAGVLFQIRVPVGLCREAMPSVQKGAPSRT